MTSHKIIIRPGNPLALPHDQLHDLAESISQLDANWEVQFDSVEQRGYSVTWWEVLNIVIPWDSIADGVIGAIAALAVDWARRRFRTQEGAERPKYIAIYGPDGRVLKSVALLRPDSEPEDRTAQDQAEAERLRQ
jgi:hypothetical protein